MRHLNADLRAAAKLLFAEDQAPWWRPPSIKVQMKKEKAAGSVSKATRRVLKRWKRERANKQATPGSSSAPSKKDDSPTGYEGVTSKSAPASGRDHDAHLEGAAKRLAAKEQEERVRLEAAASPPLAPPSPPPASMEKDEGVQPSDSIWWRFSELIPVALQRADPVPTRAAAREQLETRRLAGLAPPPPRFRPPAAH